MNDPPSAMARPISISCREKCKERQEELTRLLMREGVNPGRQGNRKSGMCIVKTANCKEAHLIKISQVVLPTSNLARVPC